MIESFSVPKCHNTAKANFLLTTLSCITRGVTCNVDGILDTPLSYFWYSRLYLIRYDSGDPSDSRVTRL